MFLTTAETVIAAALGGVGGTVLSVVLGQRLTAKRELTQAEQRRVDQAAKRRVEAYVGLRVATWQLRVNIAAGDEKAAITSTTQFTDAVETAMPLS